MKKIKNIFFILFFTTSILGQNQENEIGEKIPCEEIDLGCFILGREIAGEHVINSNLEYQELLQNLSPHGDCSNYELPIIDFNSYTLIGYISSIAGCGPPQVTHEITKHNNEYRINIHILQKGLCLSNNPIKLWCLIPKLDENASHKFYFEKNQ